MLLDRLLLLYGGPSAVAHPQESSGETAGSSGGDAGQPGGAAAEGQEQPLAQGQEADAEVEAQPGGGEEVESAEALAAVPTPLLLPMPPEKLVDVVQVGACAACPLCLLCRAWACRGGGLGGVSDLAAGAGS